MPDPAENLKNHIKQTAAVHGAKYELRKQLGHGGMGVVGVVVESDRYLLVRRSQTVLAPGKICFPGGGIEPGESPSQALVREFQEELGVTVRPVRFDWENVTPWGVHLQWWIAELAPNQTPIPSPDEVEEVIYLTLEEMLTHPDMLESNRPYLLKRRENRG